MSVELVPGSPRGPGAGEWLEDDRLGDLLARSGRGEVNAFMDFYDATCNLVWRLERRRYRARELAQAAARRRFVAAWARAAEQSGSGLSTRAWLLSLPTRCAGESQ